LGSYEAGTFADEILFNRMDRIYRIVLFWGKKKWLVAVAGLCFGLFFLNKHAITVRLEPTPASSKQPAAASVGGGQPIPPAAFCSFPN
jgi:hypothetical protein